VLRFNVRLWLFRESNEITSGAVDGEAATRNNASAPSEQIPANEEYDNGNLCRRPDLVSTATTCSKPLSFTRHTTRSFERNAYRAYPNTHCGTPISALISRIGAILPSRSEYRFHHPVPSEMK